MTIVIPLHDRVLVRRNDTDSQTASGIVIPDAAKEKPSQGTVLAVGPGKVDKSGVFVSTTVKEGDTVLFAKGAGLKVKIDDEELVMITENELFATIKPTVV
jgi:chaperonin GroES